MPFYRLSTLLFALLLLAITTQVGAELRCTNSWPHIPQADILDCRHIISRLPSLDFNPEKQRQFGNITLTLGPLREDPFCLPAKLYHGTCTISARAYLPGHPFSPATLTKEEEYYYLWGLIKERASTGIARCLEQGWKVAQHVENYAVPGSIPVGVAVTVGRLPPGFDYIAGVTTLQIV